MTPEIAWISPQVTPPPELVSTLTERARIDTIWLATSWRYSDPEAGIWGHVLEAGDSTECPGPLTPWHLGCASHDNWAQHLNGTWWATADAAKTALAAAVLEHRAATRDEAVAAIIAGRAVPPEAGTGKCRECNPTPPYEHEQSCMRFGDRS